MQRAHITNPGCWCESEQTLDVAAGPHDRLRPTIVPAESTTRATWAWRTSTSGSANRKSAGSPHSANPTESGSLQFCGEQRPDQGFQPLPVRRDAIRIPHLQGVLGRVISTSVRSKSLEGNARAGSRTGRSWPVTNSRLSSMACSSSGVGASLCWRAHIARMVATSPCWAPGPNGGFRGWSRAGCSRGWRPLGSLP